MKAFSGYEETKVNNFDYERLTLGGHICKILEVSIEKFAMKETGEEFEQLVLKIDIEDPDEQAGFYQRKYADDAKRDALSAKWKGYFIFLKMILQMELKLHLKHLQLLLKTQIQVINGIGKKIL